MKGTEGSPSKELKDMLKYLEDSTDRNVINEDLKEIHTLVNEIKGDEEVGISYMKAIEYEMMWKEEGREEARVEAVANMLRKLAPEEIIELGYEREMVIEIHQRIKEGNHNNE